jgi:hypothetical protein
MIIAEARVQIEDTDAGLPVTVENDPFLQVQPSNLIETEPIDTMFCSNASEYDLTQWNNESFFFRVFIFEKFDQKNSSHNIRRNVAPNYIFPVSSTGSSSVS